MTGRSCALTCALLCFCVNAEQTDATLFTETEIKLSEYYQLEPVEIRQGEELKSRVAGFVDLSSMSIYEILALGTDSIAELRRLARLFIKHDRKIMQRLKAFDTIYQEEARK